MMDRMCSARASISSRFVCGAVGFVFTGSGAAMYPLWYGHGAPGARVVWIIVRQSSCLARQSH